MLFPPWGPNPIITSLPFILSRAVPSRQYSDDALLLASSGRCHDGHDRESVWASGVFLSAEAATLFRLLSPPGLRPEACKLSGRGRQLLGGFWRVGRIDVSPIRHAPHWLGCFPLRMCCWLVGSPFLRWQGCGSFPVVPCSPLQGTADWRYF